MKFIIYKCFRVRIYYICIYFFEAKLTFKVRCDAVSVYFSKRLAVVVYKCNES